DRSARPRLRVVRLLGGSRELSAVARRSPGGDALPRGRAGRGEGEPSRQGRGAGQSHRGPIRRGRPPERGGLYRPRLAACRHRHGAGRRPRGPRIPSPMTRPSSGVLSVEKGAGVTSFQVVAHLRRLLRAPKVGHGGTLDPDATGVLPILIGEATKL